MADVHDTVAAVVQTSYARLISYLSARSGDVSAAEDALSEAILGAIRSWPTDGIPHKPDAWLLHAARHRLIDRARLDQTRDRNAESLRALIAEAETLTDTSAFPDERLKLLFVCAHPAIDARVHTPLMLQVVLGLDASAIAAAFVTPTATVAQRLARAKAKIKQTRIAFEIPVAHQLPERLFAVLEAIYAAYGYGWEDADGADGSRSGLRTEAIWLARMVVELLPEEPEALGLLALLQYCEARRPARRTEEGDYVPLSAQDTRLWSQPLLDEAERLLARAATRRQLGRFQLEAAVQSAHVQRLRGGNVDWSAIVTLYEGLVRIAPTIGALLGRAAAVAEARGPAAALELLDVIPSELVRSHQPYWTARAHVLQRLGAHDQAAEAYEAALALTQDPAVRRFLVRAAARA